MHIKSPKQINYCTLGGGEGPDRAADLRMAKLM